MKSVSASEANRNFSKLLGEVRKGGTVTITAHGEPVARLVPVSDREEIAVEEKREAACKLLWERLRSQPALNIGTMTRDEIYSFLE